MTLNPVSERRQRKRGRWSWVGYVLAVALLVAIFHKTDLPAMWAIIKAANRPLVVLMLALAHLQFLMAAYIWRRFLVHRGVNLDLARLTGFYFIGNFFSTLLPSRYSGDVYRVYAVSQRSGTVYTAAASVLMERLAGIFVLLAMGLGASLFAGRILHQASSTYSIVMVFGIFFSATALLFTGKLFYVVDRALSRFRLQFILRPMERFHDAVMEYRGHHAFLVKTNLIAFFIKMFAFVCIYLGAAALGIRVSMAAVVLVMPLIYVVEAAPISIGGIGIREGAFVFFFTKVGLTIEQAFALSIIVLFGRFCCALSGGVLYLATRHRVPRPVPMIEPVAAVKRSRREIRKQPLEVA